MSGVRPVLLGAMRLLDTLLAESGPPFRLVKAPAPSAVRRGALVMLVADPFCAIPDSSFW
jgi:hypothetical protein